MILRPSMLLPLLHDPGFCAPTQCRRSARLGLAFAEDVGSSLYVSRLSDSCTKSADEGTSRP